MSHHHPPRHTDGGTKSAAATNIKSQEYPDIPKISQIAPDYPKIDDLSKAFILATRENFLSKPKNMRIRANN